VLAATAMTEVLFLPKFHPELNPIEQCWGRAKWYYHQLPASSLEEDLEQNVIESLESIPVTLMCW
jgi:transposase